MDNNITLQGKVIVLDSYDGAEHQKRTHKKKTSILSFSSQMFSAETLAAGASPEESFNILTWQKMEVKGSLSIT